MTSSQEMASTMTNSLEDLTGSSPNKDPVPEVAFPELTPRSFAKADEGTPASMELSTSLSQDCLGYIEISGLAKANDGQFATLRIPREVPDPLSIDENYWDSDGLPIGEPSKRDRNTLPWSGSEVTLKLKMGELIGAGSSGWVYAVEVIPSYPGCSFSTPPLVVKVAKQTGGRRISEEAEAYDQLRGAQGTATGICYGYFRRSVNLQELSIPPWDPECTFPRSKETFDVHDMPNPCASLSVLLLQRLGKSLQDTVDPSRSDSLRNIPPEVLREQLLEMCRGLFPPFDLVHLDIRPENILRASLTAPALTSSSDTSNPANPWRLVDWEKVEKLRLPLECSDPFSIYSHAIQDMLDDVCPALYDAEDRLKRKEERRARKLRMKARSG
ncbi:hypothetical protein VTO73DRAFT_4446 [Trametes versicolor]